MKDITCIDDLRQLARRKVPRAFFDYADSGSYQEETLHANRADLQAIKLRQRVLVDVSERSLATTVIGQKLSSPMILAPVGLTGMQHGDGEILAARAAEAAGIPYTLSTMSICSIEDVAERDQLSRSGSSFTSSATAASPRTYWRARRLRNATRWCSPSTCRCSASATATSRTA